VEVSAHLEELQRNGERLADAAEQAGLRADVPSCPGWQVRDLLRHQGYVHRWAARYVAEQLSEPVTEPTEAEVLAADPPSDAELLDWFRAGHTDLVRTLTSADPATSCWTFLPAPSPLAFWARRQAHETAIHRVDAEQALGEVTEIAAAFAADGIDELIMGFFGRDATNPAAQQPAGRRLSVCVLTTDAAGEWLVELTEDGTHTASVQRAEGAATCTLTGPAPGLYRLLWNRADAVAAGVQVGGDAAVLTAWRDGMHVTWQ
jgi:uncharacterized protein (TIGR03083 family)